MSVLPDPCRVCGEPIYSYQETAWDDRLRLIFHATCYEQAGIASKSVEVMPSLNDPDGAIERYPPLTRGDA